MAPFDSDLGRDYVYPVPDPIVRAAEDTVDGGKRARERGLIRSWARRIPTDHAIVDFGCGPGGQFDILARHLGRDAVLIGFEPDRARARRAAERARALGVAHRIVSDRPALHQALAARPFAVLMNQVLGHVSAAQARAIVDALRGAACTPTLDLAISVPISTPALQGLAGAESWRPPQDFHHRVDFAPHAGDAVPRAVRVGLSRRAFAAMACDPPHLSLPVRSFFVEDVGAWSGRLQPLRHLPQGLARAFASPPRWRGFLYAAHAFPPHEPWLPSLADAFFFFHCPA